MKNLIKRESTNLKKFSLKIKLLFLYKSFLHDYKLHFKIREIFCIFRQKFYKTFFFVRLKTRCLFNLNSNNIVSFFKLSRQVFKNTTSYGFIYGLKKGSW